MPPLAPGPIGVAAQPYSRSLRQQLDDTMQALQGQRNAWWVHWRALADYILPRRYRWLVTPNEYTRGSPLNNNIIDSTGTLAARTCASGMLSGITSPARPWFKMGIEGFNLDDTSNPVSIWLSECEKIMYRIFAQSNFYNSMGVLFFDLTVFATAAMIIYEDYEDIIRCENPALGEFFLASDARGRACPMYREFNMTVAQMVEEFGIDALSVGTRAMAMNGGPSLQQEIIVRHAIDKNKEMYNLPRVFKYVEVYWERGAPQTDDKGQQIFLRKRGFFEEPFVAARWDVTANDAYGRGPGMDALGDIKQLQQEQRRKAEAIDKMVRPPMLADSRMKNQPASTLPGGVTYIDGLMGGAKPGFMPAYQVNPMINDLMLDIQQVQQRINKVFFVDLFMMMENLPAQTMRTATEIDTRREEKLVALGPVLERFFNEVLDPIVDRVFGIASRKGILPPAPPEIEGMQIEVQYISTLAESQRASATAAIERVFAFAGNLAAVKPQILDNLDEDQGLVEYAGLLRVDPKIVRDKQAVAAIRAQAAQQQQAMEAMQVAAAGVEGAKTLSETEVGGGQNALQLIMGGLG